jgi:putative transcriptional regulator
MRFGLLQLVSLLAAGVVAGSPADAEGLSKGKFLVADRSLAGSNFGESVVLLIRYDESGAMGLVVNRMTPVRADKLLPDVSGLAERGDRVYVGGPVETYKIFLLVRSATAPADTTAVIDEVYFGNSLDLIAEQAAEGDAVFRVIAGYAGWGPGQLDAELAEGAWHVLAADSAAVFDENPEGLWERLVARTEVRVAGGLEGGIGFSINRSQP